LFPYLLPLWFTPPTGYPLLACPAAALCCPIPHPPSQQRLAKLPMRRLVPKGFVFVFVEKQHVQALCRQVRALCWACACVCGGAAAYVRALCRQVPACLPAL